MPRSERRDSGPSREERVAAALETLEQGIDSILTSEGFAAYLRTAARFHQYSFGNVILIQMQRPDATRVAGYTKWQELGRQVKKGAKGIKILVPHKTRIQPDNEGEEEKYILTGFGVGNVFDIADTEGNDLPEPPLVQEMQESSDRGAALYGLLASFVSQEGISLVREDTGTANGYYDPTRRVIAVHPRLSGDQATKTLTHETSHYVAGHTLSDNSRDVETVAESAAFVVLNHFNLDSSGYSFPYVARWAQDRAVFKRNLEAIQTTAHTVIAGLEALEVPPIVAPAYEDPAPTEHVVFQQGTFW